MKATELFESFTNLLDAADEQELVEPIMEWLIANSEYYICKDDVELRAEALERTDLVEST